MLVLTREVDQTICIGDDIVVTIVAVDRNQVRVGVAAPRAVKVHRGEVYQDRANGVDRRESNGIAKTSEPNGVAKTRVR